MKSFIRTAAVVVSIVLSTGCSMAQMKTSALDQYHGAKNAINDPQDETVEVAVMKGDTKVGTSGDVTVSIYDGNEFAVIRKSAVGGVKCTITNPEGEVSLLLKEKQHIAGKMTKTTYGVTEYTPHGSVNDTKCIVI